MSYCCMPKFFERCLFSALDRLSIDYFPCRNVLGCSNEGSIVKAANGKDAGCRYHAICYEVMDRHMTDWY